MEIAEQGQARQQTQKSPATERMLSGRAFRRQLKKVRIR